MDLTTARKIARAIATPYARRFFSTPKRLSKVAWIAAWRAIESHDAARSKITTWITRCVRLALSDYRRNSSEWGKGSPVVGCVRGSMPRYSRRRMKPGGRITPPLESANRRR